MTPAPDLNQLLTKLASAKGLPLIVFDLDGTLYNGAPRTLRILLEFAHLHAQRYPQLYGMIDRLPCAALHYKVSDTLRSLGLTDDVLIGEVEQFWAARFFTNEYVQYDLPTPGAVAFVNLMIAHGAIPVYLTGRDAPNMLQGTISAFQRDGFPVGTIKTWLILKDRFEDEDGAFKRAVIEALQRTGEVIAAFDNEPYLCNLFHSHFPDAMVYWLDTTHAPTTETLRPGIHHLDDFTPLLSC